MKRIFETSIFSLLLLLTSSKSIAQNFSIVPQPVKIMAGSGTFVLNRNSMITVPSENKELMLTAKWFSEQFAIPVHKKVAKEAPEIRFVLHKGYSKEIGDEGYQLKVTEKKVIITANKPSGIFYGLQTLLQLMPVSAAAKEKQGQNWKIPCVDITDYPRFGYRGLMLDVSRHFFTKEEVKRFIDQMAMYKYNTFHWHLTDDHGWRIEIKSLPKLTAIGAWRVPRTGAWGSFSPAEPGEAATDGGFYTQEDIREILAYAKKHYVTVIPEIDVPGHSLALIAAYPEVSCTQKQYQVSPGTNIYKIEDNALCAGNDFTYVLLNKIFTEVASLFPNRYIHIGGDEAYKGFWEKCEKCQHLMVKEHLKTGEEIQSYFINRVNKIITAKGKHIIGWDEILEGGNLPENAIVMSRNGDSGTKAAAEKKHKVIVTPWGYAYWDLYQGDPALDPLTYGSGRLSATYQYDILPNDVDEKSVLGGQGSLWTEFVPTFRHAEYMIWPRSFALAELLWSPKKSRNWNDFISRMEQQFIRFDRAGINYAKSVYDPYVKVEKDGQGKLLVKLYCEINGAEIFYTLDETNPDKFSTKYSGDYLQFPKGADHIKAVTYLNGKPLGKQLNVHIKDLLKRLE